MKYHTSASHPINGCLGEYFEKYNTCLNKGLTQFTDNYRGQDTCQQLIQM